MAIINGTDSNDTIRSAAAGGSLGGLPNATDLADTIDALAGDDTIVAGGGNDTINGGSGTDTAVFAGSIGGYAFTQVGFNVTVTDINPGDGDDGTDTLSGVESLQFADGSYDVLANYNPLSGTTDGRLVNGLGGVADFGEGILGRNDDSSTGAIDVTGLFGGALDFYGLPITQIFVNNNGNLSFTQSISQYSPTPLGASTAFAIIAGVWADLDTRFGPVAPSAGGNSTGTNLVYYDLDTAAKTFTATWDDVSYYSNGNFAGVAFQLQLIGRGGGDFDIVYRYEHVDGSRAARAGFANQDDTAIFELPGSGTADVGQLDTQPGNTGLPGLWVFSVRDGAFTPSGVGDSFTADEDTPLVVAGPGVLANDTDPLARPLAAVLYSNPLHGSVVLGADGGFTYTPFANYNGSDSFQYQVATGALASGPTTVSITVNGANDAPGNIVIDDNTTPENLVSGVNTGTGVAVGTLSASDPESPLDDLAFALVDDAGGRFVLDGRVLKTAGELNYEDATFRDIVVRVTDPQGAATDQTIRIFVQNINEGPTDIFLSGGQAVLENLPAATLIGTLSSNDAEGDPITYTRLGGPVSIVGDQVFTTLSFDHEFQGSFTFSVRASEAGGDSVDRQFTIAVDNVNEGPTAAFDTADTFRATPVNIDVSANDIDPDGDTLAVSGFTQAANGVVTQLLDILTYTPAAGFVGTDNFTYTIRDPDGAESTGFVTVTVRPGDVITVDDAAVATEDLPVNISVLDNDFLRLPDGTEVPAFDALLFVKSVTQGQHGQVTINGGFGLDYLTYTPDHDFYGTDTFFYTASDGYSDSLFSGFVTVTVENVNDDPFQIAIPLLNAVENHTLFGTLAPLRNFIADADRGIPPDDILNYVGTIATDLGGTVTVNADGSFQYVPPNGVTGYDFFELVYNDYSVDFTTGLFAENGGPHTALIRINVEGEEPVAVDDRYTIHIGQSISGNVLANDRSPPGDTPLTVLNAGGIPIASNGNFSFTGTSSGTFVSPYYAIDYAGRSSDDTALLKIVVLPQDPPPPPPGGDSGSAQGDPHFVTFDGLYYDMQGWGEFVMARATSGDTFEVQIRTRPWHEGAQVTIVSAVAAAIADHQVVVEVDGSLFVDGAATTLEQGTDPLLLSGNVRLYHTTDGAYVFADNDTGEQVRITGAGSNSYMGVTPSVAASRGNAMEGLLGNNDNNRDNDVQLADGTVLLQPVDINALYSQFANAWRVTDADSLFVYDPGQDTGDFTVLNFPPVPLQVSDLPTAQVAAAAAQVAAGGITDPFLAQAAILDLLLTGDDTFIQAIQGAQDPDDGLDVFTPPAPPLIGLVSPMGDVAEGDAGTTTLTFTVFRTGNGLDQVDVSWAVQAPGLGYTNAADHGGGLPTGTVTLLAGELEKTFTVVVTGDIVSELSEEVRVGLTATPDGYVVASGTAQQTVLNDDGPVLPDAVDDTATSDAETPVTLAPLGNDLDPIGAGLAITALGTAAHGTVQQAGNLLTYTPDAGFNGQDSFTYTIQLVGAGTDSATVTIDVAAPPPPPNAVPTAGTDAGAGAFGMPIVLLVADLLLNDSDPEGAPLSITGISLAGTNGVAVLDAGAGTITYTPDAGFSGTDSFAYLLSDGSNTTPGIVNVVVAPSAGGGNTRPVANPAAAMVDEDGVVSGTLTGFDADGDALTFLQVGPTPQGFALNPDGTWTYVPPADFNGEASVQFRTSDGTAQSLPATLQVTVVPVNDAPIALALSNASVLENAALGTVVGLLSASDVDAGDTISFSLAGSGGPFSVVGNELRVAGPLDFETVPAYALTLRATDGAGASIDRAVDIIITDVFEEPGGNPAPNFAFSSGSLGAGQVPSGPAQGVGGLVQAGPSAGLGVLIEAVGVWNAVKNAFTGLDAWLPTLGSTITVMNFVDARLDLGNATGQDLAVTVVGAKRGSVETADGNDTVSWFFHSNEGSWNNTATIGTGAGNDTIVVDDVAHTLLDNTLLADNATPGNGPLWSGGYNGRFSTATVDGGTGNDTIEAMAATLVKLVAMGGAGNDAIRGGAAADVITGGDDDDLLLGRGGADRFRFDANDGTDTLGDFSASEGDKVVLVGSDVLAISGSSFTFGTTSVTASNGHVFSAADFLFA